MIEPDAVAQPATITSKNMTAAISSQILEGPFGVRSRR